MAAAIVRHEPLGIVIQDGGTAHTAPRIVMWFYASEDEVPQWERE